MEQKHIVVFADSVSNDGLAAEMTYTINEYDKLGYKLTNTEIVAYDDRTVRFSSYLFFTLKEE